MNWKDNKIIFNLIINKNYLIEKDIITNDILFIKWDQFEMKCKYFLLFTINNNDDILWSSDNPYIDQKTRFLSKNIKTYLNKNKYSIELLNNLKNLIKINYIINYEEETINLLWCLIRNYKKNYIKFYIIKKIFNF